MLKKFVAVCIVVSYVMCFSGVSLGWSEESVPLGDYCWQGLLVGSISGSSAGYIRYADANDSTNMLKSLGYGALIGTGVGLIAGAADIAYGQKATGYYLMQNMSLGGWFGMGLGVISGGIRALNDGDVKFVGTNAAWGYLAGVLIGAGYGIYKGTKTGAKEKSSKNINFSVAFLEDSGANIVPGCHADMRF